MKNQYQQGSNKSQDSLNTGKQVQVGIYKFLLRNKEELFKLFCSIILGQADLLQPQLQSLGRLNPV